MYCHFLLGKYYPASVHMITLFYSRSTACCDRQQFSSPQLFSYWKIYQGINEIFKNILNFLLLAILNVRQSDKWLVLSCSSIQSSPSPVSLRTDIKVQSCFPPDSVAWVRLSAVRLLSGARCQAAASGQVNGSISRGRSPDTWRLNHGHTEGSYTVVRLLHSLDTAQDTYSPPARLVGERVVIKTLSSNIMQQASYLYCVMCD